MAVPPKIVVHTDLFIDHLIRGENGSPRGSGAARGAQGQSKRFKSRVVGPRAGAGEGPSALRRALSSYFCYTTVFQAIELFSLARTRQERQAVEDVLGAVRILGLNARSAPLYGARLAKVPHGAWWNGLIAGLCIDSGLPLLTDRRKEFGHFRDLVLVPTEALGRPAFSGPTKVDAW